MVAAGETMPPDEKRHLEAWESEFVLGGGEFGTSDWPGREKHVGPPPTKTSEH